MIYSLHFFSSEIKKQKIVLDCQKNPLLPCLTFISFYGSVSERQLLGTTNQSTFSPALRVNFGSETLYKVVFKR
jgi:hypothetical protein